MFKRKSNNFKALFFLAACLPVTVAIGVGSYFVIKNTTDQAIDKNDESSNQNRYLTEDQFNAIGLEQVSYSFEDKKIQSKETAQYFYDKNNIDQINIFLTEIGNPRNLSSPSKTVLNPTIATDLEIIKNQFGDAADISGSTLFLKIDYFLDVIPNNQQVQESKSNEVKTKTFYISISNFLNNEQKAKFDELESLAQETKAKFVNNTSLFSSIFNYNYSMDAGVPKPDDSNITLVNGNIQIQFLTATQAFDFFFSDPTTSRLKPDYAAAILGNNASSYNFEFLPSDNNNYSVDTTQGIVYAPFRIFEKVSKRGVPVQIEDTIELKFLSNTESEKFNKLQRVKKVLNDTSKLSLNNQAFVYRINSIIKEQGVTFASNITLDQTLDDVVINDASIQENIPFKLKISPSADPEKKPDNKNGVIHVVFEVSNSQNGKTFSLEFPFEITHKVFNELTNQESLSKHIIDSIGRFITVNPDFKGQYYEMLPSRLYKWGKTSPITNPNLYTDEIMNIAQNFLEDPSATTKPYFKKFFNFEVPAEGFDFLVPTSENIIPPLSSPDDAITNDTKFQILFVGFENPNGTTEPTITNDAIISFPEKNASIVAKFAIVYGNSMKITSLNLNQAHGIKSTDNIFIGLQDSLASNSAAGKISYTGTADMSTTNVKNLTKADFEISNLTPDTTNPSNINNCRYYILDIKDRNENEGWVEISYYVEWKNPDTNQVIGTSINEPSIKKVSGFFQEPTSINKLNKVIETFRSDPKKYMKIKLEDGTEVLPENISPTELRKEMITFSSITGEDNEQVSFTTQSIILAFNDDGYVKLSILASGYGTTSLNEFECPWFKATKANILNKFEVQFKKFPDLTPTEFQTKYSSDVIEAVYTIKNQVGVLIPSFELSNYKIIPTNWKTDDTNGTVDFDYKIIQTDSENSSTNSSTITKTAKLTGLLSTNQQQLNNAVINQKEISNVFDFSNKDTSYYYENPEKIKDLIKSITIGANEINYDPQNSEYVFENFEVEYIDVNESTGEFSFYVTIKNTTQNISSQKIKTQFKVINKTQSIVNQKAFDYTNNLTSQLPIIIENNAPALGINELTLSNFELIVTDKNFKFSLDSMSVDSTNNNITFTIKIQQAGAIPSVEYSTFEYVYSLATKGINN